jgi:ATP-dependent DNA helicase RecG
MELSVLQLPPAKQKQLQNKGITSVEDLVHYFPRKYYDFCQPVIIKDLQHGKVQLVVGTITDILTNSKYVQVKMEDDKGNAMLVTWFGQLYMANQLFEGKVVMVGGRVTRRYRQLPEIINPTWFSRYTGYYPGIQPVYSKVKGMSDEYLQKTIQHALKLWHSIETVESSVLQDFDLVSLNESIAYLHQPKNLDEWRMGKRRLIFDALFSFEMEWKLQQETLPARSRYQMKSNPLVTEWFRRLPFQLTDEQQKVLRHFYKVMRNGNRLHGLLQGDVGSGKTIVALTLMLLAASNGYQAALMAPTTVLAKQHYEELERMASPFGISVTLLTGDLTAKEKRTVLDNIKDGSASLVVGTHSVLQADVDFQQLACLIIDEEHRFGVEQRESWQQREKNGVHLLSMSATPIPRTLAAHWYGTHLHMETIQHLPTGRQPIETKIIKKESDIFLAIQREVDNGHQVYVIVPRIEEVEDDKLTSVEEIVRRLQQTIHARIGMVTGKMKTKEMNDAMMSFSHHETDVLVATTIVEVGMNVPNATLITIYHPEQFGLAQLHQLRGRVGRGTSQSYCLLLSEDLQHPRLNALVSTNDGFVLAREDWKLRGAGEILGTSQTGMTMVMAWIEQYQNWFESIQQEVQAIYQDDSRRRWYEHTLALAMSQ